MKAAAVIPWHLHASSRTTANWNFIHKPPVVPVSLVWSLYSCRGQSCQPTQSQSHGAAPALLLLVAAAQVTVAPHEEQARSPCGGTAPADPSVSPSSPPPTSTSRGLELFISSLPGGKTSKAIRLLWQFYGA